MPEMNPAERAATAAKQWLVAHPEFQNSPANCRKLTGYIRDHLRGEYTVANLQRAYHAIASELEWKKQTRAEHEKSRLHLVTKPEPVAITEDPKAKEERERLIAVSESMSEWRRSNPHVEPYLTPRTEAALISWIVDHCESKYTVENMDKAWQAILPTLNVMIPVGAKLPESPSTREFLQMSNSERKQWIAERAPEDQVLTQG